jgi:hypothetical protein
MTIPESCSGAAAEERCGFEGDVVDALFYLGDAPRLAP